MSLSEQQAFYDEITNETEKLALLKSSYNVELDQRSKRKQLKARNPYHNEIAEDNERREKLNFQEEIERESMEKKSLVQAIQNEAAATGYPLPPSLVKLLHSNNGNNNHNNNNHVFFDVRFLRRSFSSTFVFFDVLMCLLFFSWCRYSNLHESEPPWLG